MENPQWNTWARRLQAIAQTGLTYCSNPYDRERYEEIQHIAADIMATGVGPVETAHVLELFKNQEGHPTPKVDVRAAVFRENRVLLVRERADHCWALPGGWAEIGDSPSQAAVREVKEESGYEVVAKKLVAVYDRDRHGHPPIPFHAYKMFFLCELRGGEAAYSHETDGVEFFSDDNLPALSLTRVTPAQIAHMFEHYRNPEWPISFD